MKVIFTVILICSGFYVLAQTWNGDGSNLYFNTGKVGIGTDAPVYPLHVKSLSNANIKVEGGSSGYANIRLRSGTDTDVNGWQIWTDVTNNYLDFYHAGSKMTLMTNGYMGLGTNSPLDVLHLKHSSNTSLRIEGGTNGYANIRLKAGTDTSPSGWEIWTDPANNYLDFFHGGSKMTLLTNGRLGLGTSNPDAKLTVSGDIHAEEVRVDLTVPGPDYVFEEDYDLPTLKSLQNYIHENKHLPEVPSAEEMEANGIDLGEMNMLLLKKVEELTLYVLELKKENNQHLELIKNLQSEVTQLKKPAK